MNSLPTESDESRSSNDDLNDLETELIQVNPKIFSGINKKKKQEILQSFVSVTMHSGPIPDPETLERYNQMIPNGADRIMKMAENQANHRMEIEKTVIRRQSFQSMLGQVFGLIIGIAGLASGTFLVYSDYPKTGGVIAGATVISLVSVFVIGRKSAND
jgi:uncharacterized membrane protein